MMKNTLHIGLSLFGAAAAITGCGSMSTPGDTYASSWDEVLASERWEASLEQDSSRTVAEQNVYYALPDLQTIQQAEVPSSFMQTYPRLVSRAYFRLIAEALEADRRIAMAYQQHYQALRDPDNANNPKVQRDFETARTRFYAHRQMLEGLRSWRAFHEYGSDDLDFFLKEQLRASYALYEKGAGEQRIVSHLMNELADLYHKSEGLQVRPL